MVFISDKVGAHGFKCTTTSKNNQCLLLNVITDLSDHQVSKAAADLMAYCNAHSCDDPLIAPVPTSENPFREKKFFCVLL